MKRRYLFLLVVLTLLALTPILWSQGGPRPGAPLYDTKTEVKLSGTVESVQQHAGRRGWAGTHLMLKTDSGTVEVHVGPSGYIARQQFSFAKGDSIEVTGARVRIAGKDALLAREISKEGKTLSLRNQSGIPLWSRRGRNRS
jgi:hypothetical protein